MEWKQKLALLRYIAYDLKLIHSQRLIHRYLHSGNILQDEIHSAYIADLGLSLSSNIASKSEANNDKVYGILPYMAPEILEGRLYTKASDIYSFGIIMWEILYGKPIFYDQNGEAQIQIQICFDNLRPPICENASKCYVDLMEKCWAKEPGNRPSAANIYKIFNDWLNNQEILLELSKSDEALEKFRYTYNQTHPSAFNKGKFIPYTRTLFKELLVTM
ncbi:kinase-like domain-containing protein [Gigaspora rosea]|uniref:Kinase-like domain-containing protein n=1 Tax=Gigaspora rosea TaxID=44941 RepID=A0A397WAT8_9GLOM|nr:kinase-like domain-containing protein [Gigaspora rosea]